MPANWKFIGLLVLILGIGGYITYLRADVVKHERELQTTQSILAVVKGDLTTAKSAIQNMADGIKLYREFVEKSAQANKETQRQMANQNNRLQKILDNLAVSAMAARRIQDAPTIPFFMADNADILTSVGVGIYKPGVR